MKKYLGILAALILGLIMAVPGNTAQATSGGGTGEFVVFYAEGASTSAARSAIGAAGGTVVEEIGQLGIAKVHTDDADFSRRALESDVIRSVIRNHSVGLGTTGLTHRFAEERAVEERAAYAASASKPGP